LLDIRLLAAREEEVVGTCLFVFLNTVQDKFVEMFSTFDRALVQSVNNNVVLPGRALTKDVKESVGKGFVARLLMALITRLIEHPGCSREVLVMFAQLPDETSEQGVKLLDILIAEVEVVIGKTGLRFSLAELFDMIDDGRTENFERKVS